MRRPASSRPRATTSRSSWPTCRTSCGRPLNAIIGFSQVLRKQLFGEINDKQAEYLDDILGSSRHLLSLIDDVLDLSKVEAGQIELQVAPFSLPETLERGVVIVRERASQERRAGLAVVGSGRRHRRRRRAPDQAGVFQPALERGQVHARRRLGRRRPRARVDGEVRVSVSRHRPGHRARRPGSGSSRSSSRQTRASSSARARASGWRCRSAWSSCTTAGSGSTASSGKGSTFMFTLPAPTA